VVEQRLGLEIPIDLYLEGSDQHRGWFHSSLLAAIGTRGKAPYKAVLTHGFVVDGEGKKYSKSVKNYVSPDHVIESSGAEILRLWVAAEDYRGSIRVSEEILRGLSDAYRKIRNTNRFLLGNLYDFNPDQDRVPYEKLEEIDRYALYLLHRLIKRVTEGYENYSFHSIFHEINRFCTVDLSAFYLDVSKDCLYTTPSKGPLRRSVQTVLFEIARILSPVMAPILSFTADEIWEYMPAFSDKESSVHLADFPKPADFQLSDETLAQSWETLRQVRGEVTRVLEGARQEKKIGNSLGAKVKIFAPEKIDVLLEKYQIRLADIFIVSQVEMMHTLPAESTEAKSIPELHIAVVKAEGEKCERCWKWTTTVGKNPTHPSLCYRCSQALL